MEKHINKIAIAILKEEYSDYPENDWHYNREYRMLVKAQNRVKKLNIDDVSKCFLEGDEVLYVGTYVGEVLSDRMVKLRDGTIISSIDSQPQKFRKLI